MAQWVGELFAIFGLPAMIGSEKRAFLGSNISSGPILVLAAAALAPGGADLLRSLSVRSSGGSTPRSAQISALSLLKAAGAGLLITSDTLDGLDDDMALHEISTLISWSHRVGALAPPHYGIEGEWKSAPIAHDAARAGLRAPPAAVVTVTWPKQANKTLGDDAPSTAQSAAAGLLKSLGGLITAKASESTVGSFAIVGFEWADGPAWIVLETNAAVAPPAAPTADAASSSSMSTFGDTRSPRGEGAAMSSPPPPYTPPPPVTLAAPAPQPSILIRAVRRQRDSFYDAALRRAESNPTRAVAPSLVERLSLNWANTRAREWAVSNLPAASAVATGVAAADAPEGASWIDIAVASQPLPLKAWGSDDSTALGAGVYASGAEDSSIAVALPSAIAIRAAAPSTSAIANAAILSNKGKALLLPSAFSLSQKINTFALSPPYASSPESTRPTLHSGEADGKHPPAELLWSPDPSAGGAGLPQHTVITPEVTATKRGDPGDGRVFSAVFSPSPVLARHFPADAKESSELARARADSYLTAARAVFSAAAATVAASPAIQDNQETRETRDIDDAPSPASTVLASPSPVKQQQRAPFPSSESGASLPPPPPPPPRRAASAVSSMPADASLLWSAPLSVRTRSGFAPVLLSLRAVEPPVSVPFPVGSSGDVLLSWGPAGGGAGGSIALSDIAPGGIRPLPGGPPVGDSLRVAPQALARTARSLGGMLTLEFCDEAAAPPSKFIHVLSKLYDAVANGERPAI